MADLPAVLDVLRQRPEADLQAWGCAALRNLTEEGGNDFRSRALEQGALQLVVAALQRHEANAQVQECGLAALSGFAKGLGSDAVAVAGGGLKLALKAIKDHPHHEAVCRWALSALGELLRCEKMVDELGKFSFLDLVSFAMQRHPQAAPVQASGCAFLSRLALKSDSDTVAAVDKAARGIVFNAMEVHSAELEVQACASSALGAFVLRGGHQRSMAESRAPQLLLEAMRRHKDIPTVQEKAANALRLVLGTHVEAIAATRSGASEVLVEALRLHPGCPAVLSAGLSALLGLVADAGAEEAWRFVQLPPQTPKQCDPQLLLEILRRYPETAAIVDPGLSLLWGCLVQEPGPSAAAIAVASTALDASAAKTAALGAAVLNAALNGDAAVPALPSKAGRQLLRIIKLHPSHRMLQERAWEALLTVLRLTHSTSCDGDAMLDMASMLRNLIETMKRHPGPVQRICCDVMTLCCLLSEASTHRQQLLELEAPEVVADAMQKNLEVAEMQDSACASLQCLAPGAGPAFAAAVEEVLLQALRAQPNAEAVQIRALDLLSALAGGGTARSTGAVPLALRALRSYGKESPSLAEVACRLLLRLLGPDSAGEGPEPMEGVAALILDSLGEASPSTATRTLLRHLARHSLDVTERILAEPLDLRPCAAAAAPPLLALQLLTRLARSRGGRAALRRSGARGRALEALQELSPESGLAGDALRACACAVLSRLAADGTSAAEHLDGEGHEVVMTLMAQLEGFGDAVHRSWSFLSLQNFLCGSSGHAAAARGAALERGLLQRLALSAAEPSKASTTAAAQAEDAARRRLETILVICLHTMGSCCASDDADLLSEEVLSMLIRGLDSSWALEVRERACFLLCYLANSQQKVKDILLEGALSESMLQVLKDHLADEDPEDGEAASGAIDDSEEILLELSLPDGSGDAEIAAPLRAMQLRRAELVLEVMQALPFEAAVQVVSCSAIRRLSLLSMAAMAHDTPRDAQCRALVQRLPRGLRNAVQVMRDHEQSDEVQRAAVQALQALTRLCCSLEGEDVAIQRVVDLDTVPVLARTLRNCPEDPQLQERGLDVLRLLSTRRNDVTQQLCDSCEVVPTVVEAMNLNISKAKVQEYGLSILAEAGWQGPEQQQVALQRLGVEATVRALKAFPGSGDVQTVGLAAVQALTSDNEECRVKFFSLCDILELVLQAMGNFPLLEGVQAFGLAALISLVHSKSERIGVLADLNGASMAESAMVGHPKSKRVVEFAEHLMQIMKKG